MNRCEAPNCKMRTYALTEEQMKLSKNNYIVSFHKFPDDPDQRRAWIDAAKAPFWKPPLYSSLCSLHFRDDCFNDSYELYDHAIPTIFFNDFRSHIKEIIKNLDLECILSGDENVKTNELALNIDTLKEAGPSSSVSDDKLSDFIECEEVVVFDDKSQFGIENISIPDVSENNDVEMTENIKIQPSFKKPGPACSKTNQKPSLEGKIDKPANTKVMNMIVQDPTKSDLHSTAESNVSSTLAIVSPKAQTSGVTSNIVTKSVLNSKSDTTATQKSVELARINPIDSAKSEMMLNFIKACPNSPLARMYSGGAIKSTTPLTSNTESVTQSSSTSKPATSSAYPLVSISPPSTSISRTSSSTVSLPKTSSQGNPLQSTISTLTPRPATSTSSQPAKPIIMNTTSTGLLSTTVTTKIPNHVTSRNVICTPPVTKKTIISPLSIKPKVVHASQIKPVASNIQLSNTSSINSTKAPISSFTFASSNLTPSTPPVNVPAPKKDLVSSLYDMILPGSFINFSIMEPTTRSVVEQLLNVVKQADDVVDKPKGNLALSAYLVTSKQDEDVDKPRKIITSSKIINTVTYYIKSIKKGEFVKPKDVSIICGSPAIFFVRNVVVQECDQSMNSVYIITNENILPYLHKYHKKFTSMMNSAPSMNKEKLVVTNISVPQAISVVYKPLESATHSNQIAGTVKVVPNNPVSKMQLSNNTQNTINVSKSPVSLPICVLPVTKSTSATVPVSNPITITVYPNLKAVTDGNISTTQTYTPSSSQNTIMHPFATPIARVVPSAVSVAVNLKSQACKTSVAQMHAATASTSTNPRPRPISTTVFQAVISKPQNLPMNNSPTITNPFIRTVTSKPSVPLSVKNPVARTSISTSPEIIYLGSAPTEPPVVFQPIQPSDYNTNLQSGYLSKENSLSAFNQLASTSLKRKWDEDDDDDEDDEDDPFFATPDNVNFDEEYLQQQKKEIESFENNILQKEREINNLKKKVQALRKRLNSVRNPLDSKTDEQLIEEILSKYVDTDGVQFFIGQMKISGKTYTQFRWSEDDKLFALGLLYRNPVEYNVLFQKYTLPSDKTLTKFVNKVKKAEMDDDRG